MTTHRYGDRLMMTEPAPGLPDHLVRVLGPAPGDDGVPTDWPGLSCDCEGCFEPDYEDIITGKSDELRPIYLDLKWDVCICRNCVDAGKHLDGDPAPAGGAR
jgi:hypothetical protein